MVVIISCMESALPKSSDLVATEINSFCIQNESTNGDDDDGDNGIDIAPAA